MTRPNLNRRPSMLTKGAIGNLVNRYRAVLKKCNLLNTFGSLAVASMLVLGGAAGAVAATINSSDLISSTFSVPAGDLTVNSNYNADSYANRVQAGVSNRTLELIGDGNPTWSTDGLHFTKQEHLEGTDFILSKDINAGRDTIVFNACDEALSVKSVTFNTAAGVTDSHARIQVRDTTGTNLASSHSGESVTINSIVKNGLGRALVQSDHGTVMSIGTVTVNEGQLSVSGWSDAATTSNIEIGTINMGESTTFRSYGSAAVPTAIKGKDGNLTINILGSNANVLLNEANTSVEAENLNVSVASGVENSNVRLSEETSAGVSNINVSTPASSTDTAGELSKLASVVGYAEGADGKVTPIAEKTNLNLTPTDIYDGATATVGEGGTLSNIKFVSNPNINGIAEMNAVGLHIWRNEINDMNKRLGDLRASKNAKHGVWTRVYNGKARFGSQDITNKYTAVQLGYDQQVMPGFWLGGAFSYTGGDSDFAHGDGDNDLLAFTAYGSYLAENGVFLDLTAKYGFMTNEFDIALADGTRSKGDYSNNAISFSAELGWHKPFSCGLFIEPQVEMMYGFVDDVSYTTSTGVDVKQDATTTFIGRVGLALGYKFGDFGSAYVRASALRDFAGEAEYSFSKNGGAPRHLSEDLGDSWFEFGMGANCKVTDNIHTYVDLETSHGGEVETDYRVNVGLRYTF